MDQPSKAGQSLAGPTLKISLSLSNEGGSQIDKKFRQVVKNGLKQCTLVGGLTGETRFKNSTYSLVWNWAMSVCEAM